MTENNKKSSKKKYLVLLLLLLLAFGTGVGGTMAWLTAKTDALENTFTYGDITLTLTETTTSEDYKFIPGKEIKKDPVVKVTAADDEIYLYVKVAKSQSPMWPAEATYKMASGWEKVETSANIATGETVYYREVNTSDMSAAKSTGYGVLDGDKITVAGTMTKPAGDEQPTLTFTAYAIQKGVGTVTKGWETVSAN